MACNGCVCVCVCVESPFEFEMFGVVFLTPSEPNNSTHILFVRKKQTQRFQFIFYFTLFSFRCSLFVYCNILQKVFDVLTPLKLPISRFLPH